MPEIGETLREARMRRRIDMTDVETATKIRAKYLRALESEEWELLPGPTFVKTFLRTYAEYLDLDARLLVEEYKQRYERPAGMDITPLNLRQQRRARRMAPRVGPVVIVCLGVVILLAVLYVLGRTGENDANAPTPRPAGTPAPGKKKKSGTAAANKPNKPGKPVSVRISASGTVYVCMEDARGRAVIDKRTLQVGQSAGPYRSKRFRVTFGTAAARMRVGGRSYGVAESRDPVGYEIRSGSRPKRLTGGLATCT